LSDLDEKRINRFKLLEAIYSATKGNEGYLVNVWEVGQSIGLSQDDSLNAAQYLVGEGLLAFRALGGEVGLTHDGIAEYENARTNSQSATTHFPVNIIDIANMHNSQIQQGNAGSTQNYAVAPVDLVALAHMVTDEVRRNLFKLKEGDKSAQDLHANLDTLDAQLKATTPNSTILSLVLKFFRDTASHLLSEAVLARLHGL